MAIKKAEMKTSTAGFFDKMLLEAQKKFGGDNVYVASDHEKTHYGIGIKSLALQYLLTSNIMPMERAIQISGPQLSCKSAFGFDIVRQVAEAGGDCFIIETENKTSTPLMKSIIGPELFSSKVKLLRADSLDVAQEQFTFLVNYLGDHELKTPVAILMDSINGSKSEETISKIEEEGKGDRGVGKESLMNAQFFGAMSSMLMGKPIIFLYTNHEKVDIKLGGMPQHGGPQHHTPGGDALGFHATYHIRMSSMGVLKTKTTPGTLLKMKTLKNAMGENKRELVAEMKWEYFGEKDEATGANYTNQKTWWDWDRATAELLAGPDIPRDTIKEVLTVTKSTNNSFSCKELKMTDVMPEVIGAAVNSDPKLMNELQVRLGIFNRGRVMEVADGDTPKS